MIGETGERKSAVATPDGKSRKKKKNLRYFGHVGREERGMENYVMLGEMSGKRRRGRSRTRWLGNVNTIKGPSINSMRWDARDRDKMEKCYRGCRQGSDTTRRH